MAITVVCLGLPVPVPARTTIEPEPGGSLTLRDLLVNHLAPRYAPDLVEALFDAQGLKPGYAILLDGRSAMQLGGLDLAVEDGSTVVIAAGVNGG